MTAISAEERATRPATSVPNEEGETESLAGVFVTHRFLEAAGAIAPIRWHFVTAGDPSAPAIVLVHGHPFSWAYWKPIIPRLATGRRVVAVDLKGYGQSEKRPGDWRPHRVAEELLALLDAVGLERSDIVAADRGAVFCDHLVSAHPDRVERYVRLGAPNEDELEGDHHYEDWHKEPMWAGDMLADTVRYLVGVVEPQFRHLPDEQHWEEILRQFAFPGVAQAVPRSFQESSFAKDRSDRRTTLFASISRPVLDIRGEHMGRYVAVAGSPAKVLKQRWREQVLADAGIYVAIDQPEAVAAAIVEFLAERQDADTKGLTRASPAYIAAQPQVPSGVPLVSNHDGQQEVLAGVTMTHRFVEAPGSVLPIRWHYVEAGDPSNETIVMLHGHPESWYGWRHQISHLADSYRIIAPDLKGYGQSDKRPGDFRHEAVSEEVLALLDQLGVRKFNLVAHDRGAVQADYIAGNHPQRVLRYVRMQQIGHRLLPTNSPQERLFRDPTSGPNLFGNPKAIFVRMWGRFKMKPIDQGEFDRMVSEVSHPGFAEAVPRYFQSSSFQKELYDRVSRLFRNMKLPVLVLQAGEDVGQPRWYYDDPERPLTAHLPDGRVEFIEGAGHFTTLNYPEALTRSISRFLAETKLGD